MSTIQHSTTRTRPRPSRRLLAVAVGAAVVLALVLAVVWALTLGPLSARARDERAVTDALHRLQGAQSFSEFNEQLCARDRVPQFLIDGISQADPGSGNDLDQQFRDKALARMPADVDVRGIDVDGDTADAHLGYVRDGRTVTEDVRLQREDGTWRVCKDGLGMSGMPGAPR